MIKVMPFEPEHVYALDIRKDAFIADHELIVQQTIKIASDSYCHTIKYCDKPLAIIGGIQLWPKVMEVWTLISEAISKCPIAFHKMVLNLINLYSRGLNLIRMHMFIRADYGTGQRWAKSLGFKQEAFLRRWGPECRDSYIYTRFF